MESETETRDKCFLTPDVVLFTFQITLIFVVACVSLLNLTLEWGNQNLWTVILTSCLGYIMPSPKLKSTDIGKSLKKEQLSEQPI